MPEWQPRSRSELHQNPAGADLVNPLGPAMINLYPLAQYQQPHAPDINYASEPVRRLDETKFDIRVDQTFSNAWIASSRRFSYDQAFSYVPGGGARLFCRAERLRQQSGYSQPRAQHRHRRDSRVLSTSVNQVTFGYDRIFDYISSQGTGTCASATIGGVGIPGANLGCPNGTHNCSPGAYSCGLVSVLLFGGYWSIGDRGYSPFQGGTNIYSFSDSLDLIRGKHEIKVGFGFRANQMNVGTEAFQDGFWIPGVSGNFSGLTFAPNGSKGTHER